MSPSADGVEHVDALAVGVAQPRRRDPLVHAGPSGRAGRARAPPTARRGRAGRCRRRRRRRPRRARAAAASRTSSDMAASTSRRTARPKRRRRSSTSTAARRSSASSSSSVRSALRVTRNGNCCSISMPGNSLSRWAAMTCSSGTKRSPSGRTTNRGSSDGTFTRAKRRTAGVGVAHDHGQVQRQVRDVRERVAGIDRERRQDREDPLLERLDRGTSRRPRRGRPTTTA